MRSVRWKPKRDPLKALTGCCQARRVVPPKDRSIRLNHVIFKAEHSEKGKDSPFSQKFMHKHTQVLRRKQMNHCCRRESRKGRKYFFQIAFYHVSSTKAWNWRQSSAVSLYFIWSIKRKIKPGKAKRLRCRWNHTRRGGRVLFVAWCGRGSKVVFVVKLK